MKKIASLFLFILLVFTLAGKTGTATFIFQSSRFSNDAELKDFAIKVTINKMPFNT